MITTNKLKQLKETLEQVQIELNELLRQRSQRKLFDNADDYYTSLKACEWCPQEFYKLRLFDTEIELRYNNRLQKYYIFIDTIKFEFFRNVDFQEFVFNTKIKQDKVSDKVFYLPQELTFKECVQKFSYCCTLFIQLYQSIDKLFVYNSLI